MSGYWIVSTTPPKMISNFNFKRYAWDLIARKVRLFWRRSALSSRHCRVIDEWWAISSSLYFSHKRYPDSRYIRMNNETTAHWWKSERKTPSAWPCSASYFVMVGRPFMNNTNNWRRSKKGHGNMPFSFSALTAAIDTAVASNGKAI